MPILKNDGVRQWEGKDDIPYMKWKKNMFETTNLYGKWHLMDFNGIYRWDSKGI